MANAKISELTALTSPETGDLFPIVDISDTTDAASGTTKKITLASLKASGADVDTGTDDVKFVTSKALADAGVYQAGGTDVAIADGGTGASTATNAFDNLAPTTTQGDIIYHNGTDNVRLAKGVAGQALVINSGETAPEWTSSYCRKIEVDATEVTVANTATETTLFDVSVPANYLSTNNAIKVTVYLSDFQCDTSETITFRLKYGGSTVAQLQMATTGATSTNINLNGAVITGFVIADGATNVQKGTLFFMGGDGVLEDDNITNTDGQKGFGGGNGTGAVDSTSSQTLAITAQWNATGASNTMTAELWVVEAIR